MKDYLLYVLGGLLFLAEFSKKSGASDDQQYNDVKMVPSGGGALTSGNGNEIVTSAPPPSAGENAVHVINTPAQGVNAINEILNKNANLVSTGGTSSPASIHAQLVASSKGLPYGGVSGGTAYAVSAPHAPSASQAAAIRAAGYGHILGK